ncbi:type I 3-dehydroquinate dehydratase [Natrialba sp. PRR66]|uniref:type I 3-dehydroquinate dehydratase n=1 Tax=Natrialba sp. PRR66 TaxID=3098146 RepID=UPI002B1E4471|nr:type I 3-dehydroquinate dehydratase [Natrialba sp. PRR66]
MALEFDSFTLAASTTDLSEEPAAREFADAIEFRMDLASEPVAALEAYDDQFASAPDSVPILATNRAAWEGGEATDDGRLETLAAATRFDAVEAIDIELESLRAGATAATDAREAARERDVSVVVSAHDFEATPRAVEMRETLTEACEYGDVGKLAVTAADREDALALLTVTQQLTAAGHDIATMAMGEAGSHTRAVAPIYGSRIGYAPVVPERATAPGQYDLETLAELVERLQADGPSTA